MNDLAVGDIVRVNGRVGKVIALETVNVPWGNRVQPVVLYQSGRKGRPLYAWRYKPDDDVNGHEETVEYCKRKLVDAQKHLADAEKALVRAQERRRVAQEFDLLRVMTQVEKRTKREAAA